MVARAQQASKNLCNLIKEGITNELKGKDFWTQMREKVEAEGFDLSKDIGTIPVTALYDEKYHLKTLQKIYKKHCKVRRK